MAVLYVRGLHRATNHHARSSYEKVEFGQAGKCTLDHAPALDALQGEKLVGVSRRNGRPLDDVLRRLKGDLGERQKIAALLAHGVNVRFAPNATMYVLINHRERAALLRGESIRKLEVLVEAARSSTEWVDVADLPCVFERRRVCEPDQFGRMMPCLLLFEDTEHGWVEVDIPIPF